MHWYYYGMEPIADKVIIHYGGGGDLAELIAGKLQAAGKDLSAPKTADLATVDEFHIRGRNATLELAQEMNLHLNS